MQIVPFTCDLDVDLTHSPVGANIFLPFLELNFEDRSISNDPPLTRSVIELKSLLLP